MAGKPLFQTSAYRITHFFVLPLLNPSSGPTFLLWAFCSSLKFCSLHISPLHRCVSSLPFQPERLPEWNRQLSEADAFLLWVGRVNPPVWARREILKAIPRLLPAGVIGSSGWGWGEEQAEVRNKCWKCRRATGSWAVPAIAVKMPQLWVKREDGGEPEAEGNHIASSC